MGPNFSGGYPPGGQWTRDDGGGKRRRRKKKGGFLKFMGDLIVAALVAFAIVIAIFALPYLFKFIPGDIMAFDSAVGFEKIDAFRDGLRHKHGISEMTFSHDGRSITFTDTNGTLTGIDAEGYDYGDGGEYESDLAEARRILDEWGLAK